MRLILIAFSDLSDAFPHGEVSNYYRSEWLIAMVKEVRGNPDFTPRTKDTAKWAREQLKRQTGKSSGDAVVSESVVASQRWRPMISA